MSVLADLQKWYESQCNEDWEHQYGVTIGTLDNPGWTVTIDLVNTDLEGREFEEAKDLEPERVGYVAGWRIQSSTVQVGRKSSKKFSVFS
ncbi:hypothetical protein BH18ACI2_BH18ACI2_12670 [soil metagenome]